MRSGSVLGDCYHPELVKPSKSEGTTNLSSFLTPTASLGVSQNHPQADNLLEDSKDSLKVITLIERV